MIMNLDIRDKLCGHNSKASIGIYLHPNSQLTKSVNNCKVDFFVIPETTNPNRYVRKEVGT